MIDLSSPEWMAQLIEAANQAEIESVFDDESAVVALQIGKKSCPFILSNGRVLEAAEDSEPVLTIPLTNKQLVGLVDGSIQLSTAYMQGDIKPVGSSRALVQLVELFDHKKVQSHLSSLLVD